MVKVQHDFLRTAVASKSAHKLTHSNKNNNMSSTKPLERETRFETDRGDSKYWTEIAGIWDR